jgi:sugar/nucleoside kinase (ribokinase family)
MQKKLVIAGTGCSLVDRIYPDIRFEDPLVQPFLSRRDGDGGLFPGRLVFAEQFETFSGKGLEDAVREISQGKTEAILNVGGPSIVALIHASQLLSGRGSEVRFFGTLGNDSLADFLRNKLGQTPVIPQKLRSVDKATASTIVLSDPSYHEGQGERAFINDIGSSWEMFPHDLDEHFYEADIVVFGGTALVPHLHDHLSDLLERAKEEECLTVVNTVYDFRNEFARPGMRWPMGDSDRSYGLIDLLITDKEEAQRLSGMEEADQCARFFMDQGVSALIITCGTRDTLAWSSGKHFEVLPLSTFPISADLAKELRTFRGGDTTGCGDNFVGGVLASLGWQHLEERGKFNLKECLEWGTVSGGYCCFHVGGTLLESKPGEKLASIRPYLEKYQLQLHD